MDADKLAELQFVSLREEIRETKARIFYIAAIGLFILPGGEYLSRTLDAPAIELVLPFLVVCVGLLYLSENHALMRCGRYIGQQIESRTPDFVGWEKWLEGKDPSSPRSVDRYVGYAFYLLISVYYLVSSGAAFVSGGKIAPGIAWFPAALIGLYLGLGVCFIWLLVVNIRSSTSTKLDGRES